MERRELLAAGTALAVVVAGCSSDEEPSSDDPVDEDQTEDTEDNSDDVDEENQSNESADEDASEDSDGDDTEDQEAQLEEEGDADDDAEDSEEEEPTDEEDGKKAEPEDETPGDDEVREDVEAHIADAQSALKSALEKYRDELGAPVGTIADVGFDIDISWTNVTNEARVAEGELEDALEVLDGDDEYDYPDLRKEIEKEQAEWKLIDQIAREHTWFHDSYEVLADATDLALREVTGRAQDQFAEFNDSVESFESRAEDLRDHHDTLLEYDGAGSPHNDNYDGTVEKFEIAANSAAEFADTNEMLGDAWETLEEAELDYEFERYNSAMNTGRDAEDEFDAFAEAAEGITPPTGLDDVVDDLVEVGKNYAAEASDLVDEAAEAADNQQDE